MNSNDPVKAAQSATELEDGRILFCGGRQDTPLLSFSTAGIGGGPVSFRVFSSCEIFDPRTKIAIVTKPMNHSRAHHCGVLLNDGRVLVCGGIDAAGFHLGSAELFDPKTESWELTGDFTQGVSRHAAVKMKDGKVLICGGTGKKGAQQQALIYDPPARRWWRASSMHEARFNHTLTALPSGNIIAAGGANKKVISSVEIYNPQSDTWSLHAFLKFPREAHRAVCTGSKLLISGGTGSDALRVECDEEIFIPGAA